MSESVGTTLVFGLTGYEEKTSSGSTYNPYIGGSHASKAHGLVRAGAVQIALLTLGVICNAIGMWLVASFATRGRSRCVKGPPQRRHRLAYIPCIIGCVSFTAAIVAWPIIGVKASRQFASARGLGGPVRLGWCHTVAVFSAVCSLVSGVLAFRFRNFSANVGGSGSGGVSFVSRTVSEDGIEMGGAAIARVGVGAGKRSGECSDSDSDSRIDASDQINPFRQFVGRITTRLKRQPQSGAYGRVSISDENKNAVEQAMNPFSSSFVVESYEADETGEYGDLEGELDIEDEIEALEDN